MGSYNPTCNLSGLPITYNTPVRWLLLAKNQSQMDSKEDTCSNDRVGEQVYATDFWYPWSIPIRAVSNDRAEIRSMEQGLAVDFLFDTLKRELVELPLGENEYHQPATTKDLTWDSLLDFAECGRLRIQAHRWFPAKDTQHSVIPVCDVMIREDVWQAMLALYDNSEKFSYDRLHNDQNLKEVLVRAVKKSAESKALAERLKTAVGKLNVQDLDIDSETFNLYRYGYKDCFPVTATGVVNVIPWVEDREAAGAPPEEISNLLDKVVELWKVMRVVSSLRKTWHPGTGRGSQAEEFLLCEHYYKAMATIANQEVQADTPLDEDELEAETTDTETSSA